MPKNDLIYGELAWMHWVFKNVLLFLGIRFLQNLTQGLFFFYKDATQVKMG